MPEIIKNVPTNIISGFLGVGKTTAILSLFDNKPANEIWAVLVNEFGKVGIDGKIYKANGIEVKEIPGGCVCCAQGLPLQVAVNRILRETKPDRLIIESSGIGHSGGIIKTLTGDSFNKVLNLKAGICLVDPRHLKQHAYSENDLFKEQLQFSDVLVANKSDLADAYEMKLFNELSHSFQPEKELIATTQQGVINIKWLDYEHTFRNQKNNFSPLTMPQEEHWKTHTFQYSKDVFFDIAALKIWIEDQKFIRLKGLVKTKQGCFLLNCSHTQVRVTRLDKIEGNYIEVIGITLNISQLDESIRGCID